MGFLSEICWKIWPKTLYKTSFHFNALKHVFLCLHIFDCSWNLEVTKSTFYFMVSPASQKENFDGFQSLLFRVIGSVLNQRKVMYVSLHNIYRAAVRLVAFFWSRTDPKICWKKKSFVTSRWQERYVPMMLHFIKVSLSGQLITQPTYIGQGWS